MKLGVDPEEVFLAEGVAENPSADLGDDVELNRSVVQLVAFPAAEDGGTDRGCAVRFLKPLAELVRVVPLETELLGTVGLAGLVEDVVLPELGLGIAGLGFPVDVGLGPADNKPPVVAADEVIGEEGKDGFKGVAVLAHQPFGADDRTLEPVADLKLIADLVGFDVGVEGDEVGELELGNGHAVVKVGPDTGGEGLGGLDSPGPAEGGRNEGHARLAQSGLSGFVVEIPDEYPRIRAEGADNVADVALKIGPDGLVGDLLESGAGNPAAVVNPGTGIALFAENGILSAEGAVAEGNRHDADLVFAGDLKQGLDAFFHSRGIGFPDRILEKHADGVVAGFLRPTEFLIDGPGIKGFGLPHLDGVDRGPREIVAAYQRTGLAVPLPCLLRGPAACLVGGNRCKIIGGNLLTPGKEQAQRNQ